MEEDISRWEKRPQFEELLERMRHHTKALLDILELAERSSKSKKVAELVYEEAVVRGANIFRIRKRLAELLGKKEKGE